MGLKKIFLKYILAHHVGLTSDVAPVGVVDLLHLPVPERQLPHPVHAAPHSSGQAQVGVVGSRVETVTGEVVVAEDIEDDR